MPHYCDSKVLEQDWYSWLVGEATPCLDGYRAAGLLATKVLSPKGPVQDVACDGQKPDPFWGLPLEPRRAHCIITATPVFCNSYNGRCDKPRYFDGSRPITCDLPPATSTPCSLALKRVAAKGYILEHPVRKAWDDMLKSVQATCRGISLKFNLPSDEAREELAAEAFMHVVKKIKDRKLVYTPGRAPVFNLLTTTIFRVMYSILNKSNKDRDNRADHARLVAPVAARGQRRSSRRVTTRRVFGCLVASA